MALSFQSVQIAYKIFHELGVKNVPSFPQDMQRWEEDMRGHPKTDTVYGFDKKSDGGWENLFFFTDNPPSPELLAKFEKEKRRVPNTSMSKMYSQNKDLWIIGWI